MASWNKNYDPALIAQMIDESKLVSENGEISFKGFPYFEYCVLLNSMVQFDERIPDSIYSSLINQCASITAKKGRVTSNNLIKEISKREAAYLNKPPEKYRLFTELSVAAYCRLPNFTIDKSRIIFQPKLTRAIRRGRADLVTSAKYALSAELPEHYTPLTVSVTARSTTEAANAALERLDFIRALLNLCLNRASGTRISSGKRYPVNSLVLGPVHTLHKPTGELATKSWWYEPHYQGSINTYTQNSKITILNSFSQKVRTMLRKSSYSDKLRSAIIRYGRALDLTDWESAFLRLWSILETLTDTTDKSYNVTIRRVACLFSKCDYTYQVLSHLRDHRNRAVHAGTKPDDIEAIMYQVKRYVEVTLEFHLGNAGRFASLQEAANFMDMPNDHSQLVRKIELMKFALKFHSK